MGRYWALWAVSILLRIGGYLWIGVTIIATLLSLVTLVASASDVPTQSQTIPLPPSPTFEIPTFEIPTFEMPLLPDTRGAAAGVTAMVFLVGLVLNLFWGLVMIAGGQFLVLMMDLEHNTRKGRRPAVPVDPVDGPWEQPQSRQRPRRFIDDDDDQYAPPRR